VLFFSSMISDSLIIRDSFQLRDSIAQSGIKVKEPSRLLFLLERPEGSHVMRDDDRRWYLQVVGVNKSSQTLLQLSNRGANCAIPLVSRSIIVHFDSFDRSL
jgi:hypothetical protein